MSRFFVLSLLVNIVLVTTTFSAGTLAAEEPVRLIAHRGGVVNDSIIENNRAAIAEAVRRGYWMVEADVRLSRDGVLVVQHDRTFERYYGDKRSVGELGWNQISQLRSTPGGESPLRLADYAGACRGKLQIMLDVKENDLSPEQLSAIESILTENGLLKTAYLIGTDQAKEHFRDKIRLGANAQTIFDAADRGEPVSERYFLFDRGSRVTEAVVKQVRQLDVPIVAAINRFRYPDDEETALQLAKADIARLLAVGVTEFQIDSQYDVLFPKPGNK